MVEKQLATEETSKGFLISPLSASLDTNAKLMSCVQLFLNVILSKSKN